MVRPGICGSPDAKAAQTIAISRIFDEHMAKPPRMSLLKFSAYFRPFLTAAGDSMQHGCNIRKPGREPGSARRTQTNPRFAICSKLIYTRHATSTDPQRNSVPTEKEAPIEGPPQAVAAQGAGVTSSSHPRQREGNPRRSHTAW